MLMRCAVVQLLRTNRFGLAVPSRVSIRMVERITEHLQALIMERAPEMWSASAEQERAHRRHSANSVRSDGRFDAVEEADSNMIF